MGQNPISHPIYPMYVEPVHPGGFGFGYRVHVPPMIPGYPTMGPQPPRRNSSETRQAALHIMADAFFDSAASRADSGLPHPE
jgi:hypothetical protein